MIGNGVKIMTNSKGDNASINTNCAQLLTISRQFSLSMPHATTKEITNIVSYSHHSSDLQEPGVRDHRVIGFLVVHPLKKYLLCVDILCKEFSLPNPTKYT